MGGEIAQWREWSEERSLDWHLLDEDDHRGVSTLVGDLNHIARERPALYQLDVEPRGFQWIDVNNHLENILAFMRQSAEGDRVVCVCNFSAARRPGYRFGLPEPGTYKLILNTDSSYYAGGNSLHINCVNADEQPWHGLPFSAVVDLPPLTTLWFEAPQPGVSNGVKPDSCDAPPDETPAASPATVKKSRKRAPAKSKKAKAESADITSEGTAATAEGIGATGEASAEAIGEAAKPATATKTAAKKSARKVSNRSLRKKSE
jgi:1,4-alpha-glucan branching enzyme